MLSRLILLVRRMIRARKYGFTFTGTTHFQPPPQLKFGAKSLPYITLGEKGNTHDLINLLLDDDYGIESLNLTEAPKTILDIGANCGLFSLLASQRFPHAHIHAYEPNPRAHHCARQNLQPTPVQLFPEGISSEEGRATLTDLSDSTLARTTPQPEGSIPLTSLQTAIDRLPGKSVDLLKIDCEGAEWEIFKSEKTFSAVKRIRLEYHLIDGKKWEDLIEFINRIDFKIEKHQPNTGFGIVWLINKKGLTQRRYDAT